MKAISPAIACLVFVLSVFTVMPASAAAPGRWYLACGPENDLLRALRQGGAEVEVFSSPAGAVAAAKPGAVVLLLADGYPETPLRVDKAVFGQAVAKELRLYVEFPEGLPGLTFAATRKPAWERLVISAETMGPDLPKGRLLMAHDFYLRPTTAAEPLVVAARVAGYNSALYGIPPAATPVLFAIENGSVLVAATKLSSFATGRYAPTREWQALWDFILGRLTGQQQKPLSWEPLVTTAFRPEEPLAGDFELRAFHAAAQWHFDSRLLLTADRWPEVRQVLLSGGELVPAPLPGQPAGDGRWGILEGYTSQIRHDGRQLQRAPLRADCQAESAMVLAMDWSLHQAPRSRAVASNLLDYLYYTSDLCQGPRAEPAHPAYGLVGWGSTAPTWKIANYGDDNGRVMLATMLGAASLDLENWDEPLLRALYANLRTTGRLGFRGDRIDLGALEQHGWRHFHDASPVNYSPHFEAANWACFLWAYQQTGDRAFLEKTRTAIRMMMEGFPNRWRWNDNIERARMLLCLAWLVRLEDTPAHRQWLRQMAEELISIQHATGALPERFRPNSPSHLQVPSSNEAYGTGETPLLQQNGDPVTDQLYVGGFALLGLHEAEAVLKDPRVRAAEDKLAAYLCRIQTRSRQLPEFNGTWFRAFDFARWEPWASSGDAGWGAWSVEAGWAQAWTSATLGLRAKQTTFWDLTTKMRLKGKLSRVQMDHGE